MSESNELDKNESGVEAGHPITNMLQRAEEARQLADGQPAGTSDQSLSSKESEVEPLTSGVERQEPEPAKGLSDLDQFLPMLDAAMKQGAQEEAARNARLDSIEAKLDQLLAKLAG